MERSQAIAWLGSGAEEERSEVSFLNCDLVAEAALTIVLAPEKW